MLRLGVNIFWPGGADLCLGYCELSVCLCACVVLTTFRVLSTMVFSFAFPFSRPGSVVDRPLY